MRTTLIAALVCLASCGGKKDAPAKDAAASSGAEPTRTNAPAPGSCPRTGHWGECEVFVRLDQAGLAPQATTESIGDLPDLGVKPVTYTIGRAAIAFYVFRDSTARHKAGASLDTMKFIPQTKPISMRNEGTLIQNDNGLAILYSKNEHQRERTADAITAGPPQP